MPWSGSCQRRSTACTIASMTRQCSSWTEPRAADDGGDEIGDRPEDVELDLAVGGVADAHRPRPGIAGQRLDHGLRARARAPRPCRAGAGAPGGRPCARCTRRPSAGTPRPRRASRGRRARAPSSRRRAASSSGSPSCARRRAPRGATSSPRRGSSRSGRGRARAGSARCARRPSWRVAGSRSPADPVEPRLLGPRLAIVDRVGMGADVVGVEAQLERHRARRRPRDRPRRAPCRGHRPRTRPTRRPARRA